MSKGRMILAVPCVYLSMLIVLTGQICIPTPPPLDGGDESGQGNPCVSNTGPVANAGSDIEVALGNRAQLDGRGSSDEDGDTLSYLWSTVRGPQSVVLDGAETATPSFIPPAEGMYEFTVTVSDDCTTDEDTVSVSVGPSSCLGYPIARARTDRPMIQGGTSSTLDGTRSEDLCGLDLSYSWRWTGGLQGVDLLDSNTATPSFTAPKVTKDVEVTFELTVSNGTYSATDPVTITITQAAPPPPPPVAHAGDDQTVDEGAEVTLDGSKSYDPDDRVLTYSWSQTDGPHASLSDQTASNPTFTAPAVELETTLTFELTVLNGLETCTDSVNVTVKDIGTDIDGDGIPDAEDNCPNNSNPGQDDSDGDGAGDACDRCPDDPDKTEPGTCGCGIPDTDTDGDDTPDCNDNCPDDPSKTEPGQCGCDAADTDTDGDGTADCVDNCPDVANPDQSDSDGDSIGNVCDPCETDAECDDGAFCNGVETCADGECQAGEAPCPAGQTCDEDNDTCELPGGCTPIGGTIITDTHLTLAASPYCVDSNLRLQDAALTIDPGVTVLFSVNRGIVVGTGGKLVARGTAAQPITFTRRQSPNGSWARIQFQTGSIGSERDDDGNFTGNGSILEHCIFKYAADIDNSWALEVHDIALDVNSCTFTDNFRGAIYLNVGADYSRIRNCMIEKNGGPGIYTGTIDAVSIANNTIRRNNGWGIRGGSGTAGPFYTSQIENNTVELQLKDGGIFWQWGNAVIAGNTTRENNGVGICIDYASYGTPVLTNNTSADNNGPGMLLDKCDAELTGNVITGNGKTSFDQHGRGIYIKVTNTSSISLAGDRIIDNKGLSAVYVFEYHPYGRIRLNRTESCAGATQIYGNDGWQVYNDRGWTGSFEPDGNGNIDARWVWWGSAAGPADGDIYDNDENASKGVVVSYPFCTSEP